MAKKLGDVFAELPQDIRDIDVEHLVMVLHRADSDQHEILRFNTTPEDATRLFAWLGSDGAMEEVISEVEHPDPKAH